jgi:hypothetical protein
MKKIPAPLDVIKSPEFEACYNKLMMVRPTYDGFGMVYDSKPYAEECYRYNELEAAW